MSFLLAGTAHPTNLRLLLPSGPSGRWHWFSLPSFLFPKRKRLYYAGVARFFLFCICILVRRAQTALPSFVGFRFALPNLQVLPAALRAAGTGFLCLTFFFPTKKVRFFRCGLWPHPTPSFFFLYIFSSLLLFLSLIQFYFGPWEGLFHSFHEAV